MTENEKESNRMRISEQASAGKGKEEDKFYHQASAAVDHLQSLGVNFVAFDFDRTILKIHTGGVWQGTADDLKAHARPEISHFIQCIARRREGNKVEDRSIHLAVVTFSGQIGLIREVLSHILRNTLNFDAKSIPIRGEDGSWNEPSPTQGWWPENADLNYDSAKQPHMLSAIQELQSSRNTGVVKIEQSTSLLIDDDDFNIQVANQNGVRAIRLYPNNPQRLFSDIITLR